MYDDIMPTFACCQGGFATVMASPKPVWDVEVFSKILSDCNWSQLFTYQLHYHYSSGMHTQELS